MWLTGNCPHVTLVQRSDGILTAEEELPEDPQKPWLEPNSAGVRALDDILRNTHFIKTLPQYTRFRLVTKNTVV